MPQKLNRELFAKVCGVLEEGGHLDLAKALAPLKGEVLTSRQAAEVLGVSSPNTVKNWLEGGHFPGAFQTQGGHWRFLVDEVLAVKVRDEELRAQNAAGDLSLWEVDEDVEPPLL